MRTRTHDHLLAAAIVLVAGTFVGTGAAGLPGGVALLVIVTAIVCATYVSSKGAPWG